MTILDRSGAWPARVLWVVLAVLAAVPVGDALDGRSAAVRWLVVAGLWLGWTAGLVCLLVPRHLFLTGMRILVPAGTAAMIAAIAAGSDLAPVDVVALAVSAVASAWVLSPWVGEAWVDGSSYGPERRLPLRPPVAFALLVVPVTWAAVVGGATVGPLLLAAGRWVPGVLATAIGAPVAVLGTRSLHQLSRRWIVLVPTGIVLHDTLVMPEPQLFLRTTIARLGPAEAGGDADDEDGSVEDLTAGAAGLALRLDLSEPVELLVRTGGRGTATVSSTAVLFTPSRPRHVLDAALERRVPVG
ncbi:MAG: hypothetical protein KF906_01190 [Actinobacteria bacterium]|nr:hypothetical protein [Actinomycetota bacterium]